MTQTWSFSWPQGAGEAQALGGMVGPVHFHLGGRNVQPLAVAPWSGEPQPPSVPGHLHRLRGAFPCLPFGVGAPLLDPVAEWAFANALPMPGPPHGHASNGLWRRANETPLTLRYDGSPEDPVAWMTQCLLPAPERPALAVEVTAATRADARLPFGQHWLLRLPVAPARVEIAADFALGLTYPGKLTPGISRARPGARFASLADVPAEHGTLDLAHLRVMPPLEEVVQLCGVGGPLVVRYPDEGWSLRIDWDRALLPCCLIWIGGAGIAEPPWSNRFLGLGIEPIAAAFDLAPAVSAGDNPIARAGFATALDFAAERPRTLVSRIELF